MKDVTIYTDGACSGNPGPGGWGAILMCDGKQKEILADETGLNGLRAFLKTAESEGLGYTGASGLYHPLYSRSRCSCL